MRILLMGPVLFAVALAQAPAAAADEPGPKTFIDLNFTALSVGASVARRVSGSFYGGVGLSGFPALAATTFSGYPLEIVAGSVFVRYQRPHFHVDAGARLAYFEEFKLCIFGPCSQSDGALVGPYVDLRFGWPAVKIGPRLHGAIRTDDGKVGASFYPLFVEVQIAPN